METSRSDSSLPLSEDGVISFLSGPWVEGIGPIFARRLVEKFGTDVVGILAAEPEKAESVQGLGKAKIEVASESIRTIQWPVPVLIFLYSCGIGDTFITRIFDKYKKRTADVVSTDPYSMVEDVWQLSFFTADKIGRELGIAPDDPRRLRGALITAVKHFAEDGNLFATLEEAVEYAAAITGVDHDLIETEIDSVVDSGRLVKSRGSLYLPVFYRAEKEGADRLAELAEYSLPLINADEIPENSRLGHKYTQEQLDAIYKALNSPVMVLTGGPGTGKTTVLRAVIEALGEKGKKVVLAAPTGRAAKRMSVLTGAEATTIHRLLGYRQGEGYRVRHIDADALIIDEGSMMEQVLFNHLLQALRPGTRVILVGDVDQLPAIGAGDVLRDMIDSGIVPVAVLNENFRQAEGSMIAAGARAINAGKYPESDDGKDFMIVSETSPRKIHDRIISLVATELPAVRGIKPTDIQVVTPQQVGSLGARQLNIDLQRRLNPEGPELHRGATVMRLGDPVMQKSNSRERGVYNGETGLITEVNPEHQTMVVTFSDGRKSTYARTELGELNLAYATTVHKLQGSEIKNMIFPITMAHKPMLYRNLLYTGVSRAEKLCVLVGEEEALKYAIRNEPSRRRRSNFKHRLRGSSHRLRE